MDEAHPGEGVMVNSGSVRRGADTGVDRQGRRLAPRGGSREATVTFRLRDWLLSRQRYWGAPIPIIHCDTCGEVACPTTSCRSCCPTTSTSSREESPLARHPTWSKVACPTCGGEARRDTDTMDTFVDSSWYFFRYCSPGPRTPFRRRTSTCGCRRISTRAGSSTRSCTSCTAGSSRRLSTTSD